MSHLAKYLCPAALVSFVVLFSVNSLAQQPQVLELEETIRGNQEQPKVLTIVPWQGPKAKQALPSSITERINKKFMPLQRDELLREIKLLDVKNTYPAP